MAAVETPSVEEVKAITKKVADWQIQAFDNQAEYRATSSSGRHDGEGKHPESDWANAALYSGMNQWRKVADQPQKYTDWLKQICDRSGWRLHGAELYDNVYHADTHLIGLIYLSLYEEFKDPAMLKPTQKMFDYILHNPSQAGLEHVAKEERKKDEHFYQHRWGWCDALYMAPPVWARLAKVTGDRKYLEFMDREYRATHDLLWDKKEHLFYRDSRFFTRFEENGKPLFWSRGNGWVFGGLALMIPDLPAGWEGRAFYVDLFKQMAESIKNCQRADGTWSMGLLGGVEGYPVIETSGTAFFTFGLAWGVNNGLLDPAVYEPVIYKAWQALTENVNGQGLLGHVQPIGARPGDSYADKTEVYGIGAFLAAGSEVYKLVGGPVPPPEKTTKGVSEITTFMQDGGWCWYQDPRAIIHDGKLFMGSVKGNETGPALVGVYDLQKDQPLGTVLMQDNFQKDDHNSPVFHVRPDGSVLAVYAKHSRETVHYSRISDSSDPLKWSDEMVHERAFTNPRDRVTYMNLYELSDEGLLYNFFRGINYNPTFVTSTDHGKTWSEPVHFFQNEVGGRHRPYPRYTSNGKDTVYVSITDAHPRNYGNSLYYFEFRDGNFYKADGTLIKNLAADGPLRPSEAERIFLGSGVERKGRYQSAPSSAWTSAIAVDGQGHPHMGYTLYLENDDIRYRLASWNGSEWIDREVAYAGKCLYVRESSYTGLITLDPTDPEVVFISTDVNPSTGEDTGGKHEIYRARISPEDDITTIQWEAVTRNSPVRNIRPVILRDGDTRVVLWNRGEFSTYTDYDLDTVGFVEKAAPNQGPFLATGIKIGEVDQTSAIVWTRLTRSAERVGFDAPVPEFLYLNDETGKYEPKPNGRPDRIPKVIYPDGSTV
ncbi:MAG TPA: glycoside hydrolase family 88 protein, partial [Tichowtungia sp.]|nr:glycoside hydrolase family 88 protein [Tichowtungia sp.]